MCECFSLQANVKEIMEYFKIDQVLSVIPARTMIKPTEDVPVIISRNGHRTLDQFAWGIFPFWAKDSVNARSETIRDHRAYRKIFTKQRCIVPCDGFYIRIPVGKKKEKHIRITMNKRRFFGMAALYDIWTCPNGAEYRTCTILTTPAAEPLSEYNSRMPVILDEEQMEQWLAARPHDEERLAGLFKPYASGHLDVRPFDEAVGGFVLKP
jgi:putative SOS response-associated peptidase YedK